MALCLSPASIFSLVHPTHSTASPNLFANQNSLSTMIFHRSSPLLSSNSKSWPCRCRAVSPGRPPPPPESDPPPNGKDPNPSEGPTATFSRLQDTVQIFFAVLFWMSLFFWASAWDGRDNGRPSKGSRFRR
ncbi:Sodium channel protein type 10 subunit alpha like [Actinidia chinensis var. chinensis]|uniref:Sodium channel protein type 10 subunit alpha like n=1 Tax=Actinidia chinensis var. chinensis TaxID=1590841 RepID=A0A2R6PSQ2_ACTCC|nr:Sodium channel protein type 10 subunit alpha like [Actinidia chinensis var. chinensis]